MAPRGRPTRLNPDATPTPVTPAPNAPTATTVSAERQAERHQSIISDSWLSRLICNDGRKSSSRLIDTFKTMALTWWNSPCLRPPLTAQSSVMPSHGSTEENETDKYV
ncbi:hypothetical protein Tco_1245795 [Tanacetum coccineum]